jgi:hypothetical protein
LCIVAHCILFINTIQLADRRVNRFFQGFFSGPGWGYTGCG